MFEFEIIQELKPNDETVSAKLKDFLKRVRLPIVKLHPLRHANITTMIAMRSRS